MRLDSNRVKESHMFVAELIGNRVRTTTKE